ncbi:Coiled-coil domain-containing protein 108 [Stylophora pistillata]|uniref:Coiled-coil domain-containing protein 108 n=1 Tax=Stylophora pistillata TaxID=50429 RepID=A0A2B4S534_STYPI|nr:Coiled-coil domain-containing protein 108 [Stylophora pistillata]
MPVQTERSVNHFGIEVSNSITWQGWEPGGEYTQQIVLKNVQIKTKKLQYKSPSSRFFTTLYPKPIVLSSGTSFTLPVTFRPLEKGHYEDCIEFETNEGIFSVPMKAVLPKADIAVPESLKFNLCAVTDCVEVVFQITNTSELITNFQWKVLEPFSIVPESGTLSPRTSCNIKATFSPKAALVYEGTAVCTYSAGQKAPFTKHVKLEGIGKFPHLVASISRQAKNTSSTEFTTKDELDLNFGEVPVQTTATKWIELHNFSPVNAPYQVLQPSSSSNMDMVFSCSHYHGVAPAESTIKLKFMIDCSQSVFKLESTCGLLPGKGSQAIIVRFSPTNPINYYRRLTCLVQNQDPLFVDLFGTCHTEQVKPAVLQKKHLDRYHTHVRRGFSKISPEQLNEDLRTNKLQLDDEGALIALETTIVPRVGLDVLQADFGQMLDPKAVEQKTTIVPHVSLDVHQADFGQLLDPKAVEQKTVNITNHTKGKITCMWIKDTKGIFSVSPDEADILPLKTASFRVTFRPNAANQLFSADLECYTFYKSMRDYRLVEVSSLVSFAQCYRSQWDVQQLVFPATTVDGMSYRTLLLTNNGQNPIHFAFDDNPSREFTCRPRTGLLTDKYQLIVFKMAPMEAKAFRCTVKCKLNDAQKFTQGTVYFKPTCLGTASTRLFEVKNTSRIPLRLTPSALTLVKKKNRAQESKSYLVRVIGEGSIGEIVCLEEAVTFGDIVVGSSASQELMIHNNSDCSLHYNLLIDQEVLGPYDDEQTARDILALEISDQNGIISARTSQKITATAYPSRRVSYKFKLSYELLSTCEGRKPLMTCPKRQLAELQCQGVYPTLCVTDVRCLGSGKAYSKVQIWDLLSLDSLNECLEADPSPSELLYAAVTRHSTRRRVPVNTRAIMDFNFGAAPLYGDPCVVHLNIQNTGTVPAEWAFLYPSDLQLELEYWAETGEYDEDELHQMQVMDNKLFSIEPRTGKLLAGECRTVTLTYSHSFIGINKLPVLFKVRRGREILLNFIGVTVDPDSYYVHFASTRHLFEPVPVGGTSPPVQVYELYNGGSRVVKYELDMEPLVQVQAQNYGCHIFECLNPSGEIPPGCAALIYWQFAPLEARTYMVDIPVHIIGGETVLVTFTGVGYDQRIMGNTLPIRDVANNTVPDKQVVQVPNQLAYLSVECIPFGDVPLYTMSRRMFFLTNTSQDHIISFRWVLEGSALEQVIMIEPDHGFLKPQQNVLLKVSLFSWGAPSLYDMDIICEIVDETEMAEYNQLLIDWTNMKEEKQYTFTITEDDMKRPHSGPHLKSISHPHPSVSHSEGDLRKYQALPPIGSPKETKRKKNRSSGRLETPPQPVPPESFLLHLGITARTHAIGEYYSNFPSAINKFMIDQRYVLSQGTGDQEREELSALVSCSRHEMRIIQDVLSVIFRGLLDDDNFHQRMSEINQEPVPYFRQLCETQYTTSSRPSSASSQSSDQSHVGGGFEDVEQIPLNKQAFVDQNVEEGVMSRTHQIIQRTSESPLSIADRLMDAEGDHENSTVQRQAVRRLPEFESLVESVLENSILNLLTEANCGEVNLTLRSRMIALPPNRTNKSTR